MYYKQLVELLRQGKASAIITYETCNPLLDCADGNVIRLFGSTAGGRENNIIFWEDTINLKKFNDATVTIASAKCVVADAAFFTINVGNTLAKYVSSNCLCLSSDDKNFMTKIGDNYTKCELSPLELILRL